ncbi:MAG: ATP-binding protein [Rhizomicrobium sp.]
MRGSPRATTTPGRIIIALEKTDDRVAFRITDNGIGLPHEHRDRLTEPYVTTRAKGTGLGLAIVRKILEDHGGELILQDAVTTRPRVSKHSTARRSS